MQVIDKAWRPCDHASTSQSIVDMAVGVFSTFYVPALSCRIAN